MNLYSRYACLLALSGLLVFSCASVADLVVESSWQALVTSDGSSLTARHEAAGVVHEDNLYLLGGRGNRPVERYSVTIGQWENLGLAPFEMHHMQPVVMGDSIYVLGAFTCCYPREEIVNEIYAFDTQEGSWDVVGSLPINRIRGGAAVVAHEGKIYLIGGNVAGHDVGAVSWFDEYDPLTDEWRELPDAPNARDHFSAVMVGDQLIAVGGRQTAQPNPASNPVTATDIFDFTVGQWRSGSPIPTPRAGVVSVAYDGHIIVAGGEINTSAVALDVIEAYDVEADTWQVLPSMTSGRHGSGGGIVGSHFYMFSGAPTTGGAFELASSERLELPVIEVTDVAVPVTTGRKGGGGGILLLVGLIGVCVLRNVNPQYSCTD
ncbi:MAG: hypothetical protein ACI8VW_002339 [bacterium]|jgi:hypothetical protein